MRTVEELNEKLFCKCNCDTCEKYIECEEDFDGFCDDILLYTKHIAGIKLDRLVEICNAERDGRCVVLPCKVGDKIFSFRWSIKNQKYEVHAGKVKNVRYDAADGSVSVSDGERYCYWGKTVFLSPESAEAALKECENNG